MIQLLRQLDDCVFAILGFFLKMKVRFYIAKGLLFLLHKWRSREQNFCIDQVVLDVKFVNVLRLNSDSAVLVIDLNIVNNLDVPLVELFLNSFLFFVICQAKFVSIDLLVELLELKLQLLENHLKPEIILFFTFIFFNDFASCFESIILRQLEVKICLHVVNSYLSRGSF